MAALATVTAPNPNYSPVGNIGDTWSAEERADERGSFLYVGELRFDLFK
jgi:hypothetical protein